MSRLQNYEGPSLDSQLLPTSSAPSQLPDHVRQLAEELVSIHGSIKVAAEASGLHLYMPCPECLKQYGEAEIYKKHLAFNVDKYFRGEQFSVLCMKCGFYCEAVALSYYPPLTERGIDFHPETVKLHEPKQEYLEKDDKGVMVPRHPGLTIPVHMLPTNHPAIEYLRSRGFDPKQLWDHMQCSWCETENSNIYFRKQPGGFRITSQGRLIFFCLMNGSKVGWQARILEFDEDGKRYFWHPYQKCWTHVLTHNLASGRWEPIEGFEAWDPAKYWTGPGTSRSRVLFGFDAAVKWNIEHGHNSLDSRFAVLSEGPLDIGRLRPPAMGTLGKSLTPDQAKAVVSHFHRVIIIGDNDEAGDTMRASVTRQLVNTGVKFAFLNLPERFKDPGSLDDASAGMFMRMARVKAFQL